MDIALQITKELERKAELFGEYEKATRALLDCEIDSMTDYITKRTQLAIEIDKIDVELRELCDETPRGALLADVIASRCAYSETPREWQGIFDAGQTVLGAVSRVVELETRALERMKELRAGLKKQITENQNTPKISKYLTNLSGQDGGEHFISNKA